MTQGKHRILIVDDDVDMLELLEVLLGDAFDVAVAEGGEQALAAVQQGSFDAIVLDLMMPQLDGEAVMERLRAMRCETPVVLVSALAEVHARARAIGAYGGERKPVDIERLKALVESAIASRGEEGGSSGSQGNAPQDPEDDRAMDARSPAMR